MLESCHRNWAEVLGNVRVLNAGATSAVWWAINGLVWVARSMSRELEDQRQLYETATCNQSTPIEIGMSARSGSRFGVWLDLSGRHEPGNRDLSAGTSRAWSGDHRAGGGDGDDCGCPDWTDP